MRLPYKPEDAVRNAGEVFRKIFPEAQFCIASGSIVTGHATHFSDLDLVVIYRHVDAAYRQSLLYQDMPVEAFVHDYETVQAFIDEDYENSHESLLDMIATGVVVPCPHQDAEKLQKYARDKLLAGPPDTPRNKLDTLRYFITDLIDDLRGDRPQEERCAILYKLYPKIGELLLRQKRCFVAEGKHLARQLKRLYPDEFPLLEGVMRAGHSGEFSAKHIGDLEKIVRSYGGLLFDGYEQKAPADKRKSPQWMTGN
ncbi:MAG: nucleotidyltransferase domain-containing protein [Alphaproteobacteria bacterium]